MELVCFRRQSFEALAQCFVIATLAVEPGGALGDWRSTLARHLHAQPGAGVGPPLLGRGHGDAEDLGGFLETEAGEVTQVHQFRLPRIERGELGQRVVDREELVVIRRSGDVHLIDVQACVAGTAFGGEAATGPVHHDAAHGLGGGGEEVLPALPSALVVPGHLEPRFMDERRGLERVLTAFSGQAMRGQTPKILVDQRKKLRRRARIAGRGGLEDLGDVAHSGRMMHGLQFDINWIVEHHPAMRTTLTLDDDVLDLAARQAKLRGVSLGRTVSDLLRKGLSAPTPALDKDGLVVFHLPADSPKVTTDDVRRIEAEGV